MNTNFYLDRNKTTKDEKTIWCYVRSKENIISLNTKEKVDYQFWDKKNQGRSADSHFSGTYSRQ